MEEKRQDLPPQSHPDSERASSTELDKASSQSHGEAVANAAPQSESEKGSAVTTGPGKPNHPSANDASSIPNGGLQAWLQVLGAFMLFFNTWGLLNTFGVFQTYYESGALFVDSSSNISWIGTIQAVGVMVVGAISGPIYDRGYLRILLIVGTFGVVFGHMMLSLSTTFWQALLAQGFCVGIGAGCLFVPAVALLPTYFTTRIGLAIGVAAAGSSMGGIIYPIVFFRLIDRIGFGWSVRVLGFMILGTQVIPIVFMKMRVKPARARALIDWSAFTDVPYMIFTVGTLIGFLGLYITLFYVSFYGQATGITDASLSFYLVPILNAASVFGRTLPNYVSDKIGPLNLIVPGALMVGVLIFCLVAVHTAAGLIVVTALFGFFSGVFIALPPVCFVMLTKDKTKIGTRMGMGFAMFAIAVLAAAPGGGRILGANDADLDWRGLWIFGGVSGLVCGSILLALRMWRAGFKVMVKV